MVAPTLGSSLVGLGQGEGYIKAGSCPQASLSPCIAGKDALPLFSLLQGLGQVPLAQTLKKKKRRGGGLGVLWMF